MSGWNRHVDRSCPRQHRYGSYSTIDDAKTACLVDIDCGYVNDWRCDGGKSQNPHIELCKHIPESRLRFNSADCVYEKMNG